MIGSLILSPSAVQMRELLHFATRRSQELVDITDEVTGVVRRSGISDGLVHVDAQGATAAVMIQENWDESVQEDVIDFLARQIPKGVWKHDAQDGNGDAHLKAGLVGPSEMIPLIEGRLGPGPPWGRRPMGGAFAPVASGHPGISGALGRVSGFPRSTCLGPGRQGNGHDAVERCSRLDLLSCDRGPGYAARGVNGRDSAMACGSTQSGWRSRCATEVMIQDCTSFAGTGSGEPGRTLVGGAVGLVPASPQVQLTPLAQLWRVLGVPVPVQRCAHPRWVYSSWLVSTHSRPRATRSWTRCGSAAGRLPSATAL